MCDGGWNIILQCSVLPARLPLYWDEAIHLCILHVLQSRHSATNAAVTFLCGMYLTYRHGSVWDLESALDIHLFVISAFEQCAVCK